MSHGRMSGISVRCILTISDGEIESNYDDVSEGAGVGCLEVGLGGTRVLMRSKDRELFVSQELAERNST